MAKEKVANAAKIEKMVDSAIKKAVKDKLQDDCLADGFDSEEIGNGEDVLTEAEHDAKLQESIGFDIFVYGEDQTNKKDMVIYTIKKNGEMLTTKYHPYSWQKLQAEFGAGSYQILARSNVTKKFLKSQTQAIGTPNDEPQFRFGPREEAPAPQTPQPNFMEIFSLMNGVNEKSRNDAKEMAKEQAQASSSTMQVFASMMQTMSMQSQTMFMEMSKMQMNVAEKMTETTAKLFEKMDARFEKLVEKMSEKKKDDSMGILELMKLSEDSQKKGFDMFNKISQIAEEKAAEKVELLEESRGSNSRHEKTSMVEKLIEGIMPVVAKSMEASNNQVQAQARGALPRQASRPYSTQAPRPGQRTSDHPLAQRTEAQANGFETNSPEVRGDSRINSKQVNVTTNNMGVASVQFPDKVKTEITKESIEEFLVSTIAAALLVLDTPVQGKERIIKVLQEKNISVELFLETFTKEDAKQIVAKYNLPEVAVAWFEEVYANIETSA